MDIRLVLRIPYFSAAAAFLHFCLLLLSLLYSAYTTEVNNPDASPSFLPLHVGLNLSIAPKTHVPGRWGLSLSNAGSGEPSLFRSAVPSIYSIYGMRDDHVFVPILSTPGFYNGSSSGFSFGFLAPRDEFDPTYILAVCSGLAGNLSYTAGYISVSSGEENYEVFLNFTDGYAVRLWTANGDTPLGMLSLEVVRGAGPGDGNVLQLSDHATGTVLWSVQDAGLMEIEDTGNLVIYDTVNKTKLVVWQSLAQPSDTLFEGQKLTAGMELRSNDSAYSARMEEGGLVLYLNKVRFNDEPAAYLVVPLSFPSIYSSHRNMSRAGLQKQLLELPCGPSYMALQRSVLTLDLEPGRCTVNHSWTTAMGPLNSANLTFLTLEIDGSLYVYTLNLYRPVIFDIDEQAVSNRIFSITSFFDWGKCAAPMACGPLGICTPSVPSLCSCPSSSVEGGTPHFEFINSNDQSKGCRLRIPLPKCILGNEHIGSTTYLQVNETATVFLFGGWPFDFLATPRVDKCKKLCSANCSCTGFFYQATNLACFFMTDAVGLLHINGQPNVSDLFDIIPSNWKIDWPVTAWSCTTYLKINSAPPLTSRKHVATARIIEASLSAAVFLLLLGSVLFLFHAMMRKRKRHKARQAENEELRDILPHLPSRFSYDDLHKATKGFSKLLGAGGCGSVYAGVLHDARKVAVKLLEAGLLKGQQSKQFLAEVATVGRTNHHNIVRLIGFCWEVNHRLLVYEYMEKGSLDQWLFANKPVDVQAKSAISAVLAPLLDWPIRYSVALGIARGLAYLHEDCMQPILHFDIKPQNILLDDDYVAKLADFGLSKLMQRGISEVVTGVRGTPGYIAPEMQTHGAVSKKSDIYSMGMVMLEIVGGRRNIDITLLNNASHEWHFPSWAAKKCEEGLMLEVVDKRIGQAYDKEQACRLIQTAFWCIHDVASKRPNASTVVQWLEGKCFISQPPFSIITHTQSSVEPVISSF